MVNERQVRFRELDDLGLVPLTWARFRGPEITYVICTMHDGKSRCWSREPGEAAEIFSARVVRDIAERCFTGVSCPGAVDGMSLAQCKA